MDDVDFIPGLTPGLQRHGRARRQRPVAAVPRRRRLRPDDAGLHDARNARPRRAAAFGLRRRQSDHGEFVQRVARRHADRADDHRAGHEHRRRRRGDSPRDIITKVTAICISTSFARRRCPTSPGISTATAASTRRIWPVREGWQERFGDDLSGNDFLSWQSNVGFTNWPTTAPTSISAPEPDAAILIFLAATWIATVARPVAATRPIIQPS